MAYINIFQFITIFTEKYKHLIHLIVLILKIMCVWGVFFHRFSINAIICKKLGLKDKIDRDVFFPLEYFHCYRLHPSETIVSIYYVKVLC